MSLNVIAMKGYKGPQVVRIQNALNKLNGAGLDPDGNFGTNTEAAVESFQKDNGFLPDGIVGPFTDAALQLVPFVQRTARVPPHIRQNSLQCWAAATASWLRAQPGRTHYTQEQIVEGMQADGFARGDGALPVSSQRAWEDRFGLRPITESASKFFAEKALSRLRLERKPLLFGFAGSMGHVMVLFGAAVTSLDPQIIVMDPLSPAFPAMRNVSDIHTRTGRVVTWMPKLPLFI